MDTIGPISLVSGLLAQLIKVLVVWFREGRLELSLFFSSGGMPSSHTSTVTTLCLLVAAREGIASPLFSLALIFSLYVVFEATGLRQEVGKQAVLLNQLMERVIATRHLDRHRLQELVGHTWAEVAAGAGCGLGVYWLAQRWFP
jgi:acid phosphatase family membrane protein YuiD